MRGSIVPISFSMFIDSAARALADRFGCSVRQARRYVERAVEQSLREERVRERQKARAGHEVAGVGIGSAHLKVEQASEDAQQHHDQRADQKQRRQVRGGGIQRVERAAH